PGARLDELQRITDLPEDAAKADEQRLEPRGTVDRQRHLALAQLERLQHPRQPEVVVAVEMADEDLLEVGQPDRRAHQLALRPLAAVEEQAVAAAPHEQSGRRTVRRRCAARRAEEDEIEVHAPIVAEPGAGRCVYGRMSRCPARTSAPLRWFARSIRQTASRTSPP